MRIICLEKNGSLSLVFNRLILALELLGRSLSFAWDPCKGYLTPAPPTSARPCGPECISGCPVWKGNRTGSMNWHRPMACRSGEPEAKKPPCPAPCLTSATGFGWESEKPVSFRIYTAASPPLLQRKNSWQYPVQDPQNHEKEHGQIDGCKSSGFGPCRTAIKKKSHRHRQHQGQRRQTCGKP